MANNYKSELGCTDYGVVSGRVTAIAVNPTDTSGNDVWIGGADGGVWHTTDGGSTWSPQHDVWNTGVPALAVGAIAINPNNPQEIFVGTGEANLNDVDAVEGAGIYVSEDGGQSFTLYATQLTATSIAKIAVSSSPANQAVLAATGSGIYESTDAGHATWQQVYSTTASDVVFDPTHPNVAYAGVVAPFMKDASGNVTSSPVVKTTNYGVAGSWTPVDIGLASGTSSVKRVGLGISQGGTGVYVLISADDGTILNGSMYRSLDSGATWQQASLGNSDMSNDNGEQQWWYELAVAVDPTDRSVIYVGGVDLWESDDSGGTWNNVTGGNSYNVHVDHHALAFIAAGSNTVQGQSGFYDGNDGGVWRGAKTCPLSCTWSFTNLNAGGLDLTQFYGGSIGTAGSHAQLYGGAQDNGESSFPAGSSPPHARGSRTRGARPNGSKTPGATGA